MPHMRLRTAFAAGATTALVGTAALAAAPAGATPAPSPTTSSAAIAAKPPLLKNYSTAVSDPVASPTMTQVRGTVHCPIGSVPLGGGVLTQSTSSLVSVNSSFPVTGGWSADISNVSNADTTFSVKVFCAAKPVHYKVVQRHVSNPAATHTTVAATCPVGSRPLGGGAASNSGSPFVTLSSTAPAGKRSWQISENNATGEDATVSVFALCGSVQDYTVVHGPVLSIPGRSIASLAALCPSGRVTTGGGAVIRSTSVGAYLDLSGSVDSHSWISFVTNTSAVPFDAGTTVVCAGIPE
jgi:hypothetical protein